MVSSVDIINRSLQLLGRKRIASVLDQNMNASESNFSYHIIRRFEQRRAAWRFCIRKVALRALNLATQQITFGNYAAGTTYVLNDVVTGSDGLTYVSLKGSNTGDDPTTTSGSWGIYLGPMQANQYVVAWVISTTYKANQFALGSNGTTYFSTVNNNIGNDPTITPAAWLVGTTYALGNFVTGSDANVYQSVAGGNVGHNPVGDGGVRWTQVLANVDGYFGWEAQTAVNATTDYSAGELVYTLPSSVYLSTISDNTLNPTTDTTGAWLSMTTTPSLANMNFIYPIGAGPSEEEDTRNVFMLPNGFMREVAQDPKAGSNSVLGAPSGIRYQDWYFENNYFTSFTPGPIFFRFAGDVLDPNQFDPMFIEDLAYALAVANCKALGGTQADMVSIQKEARLFQSQARTVNAIEKGTEEPAEDDFISCRI